MNLESSAVRADGQVHEEAGWLGRPPCRVFGVRHLPPEPCGALVVCSPVGGEGDSNYRREVLLARALARRSIAVQRFHWRGTGNSDGDPRDLTFDTMVDDACRAVDALTSVADAPVMLLGTRSSAFVAGEVTGRVGARALSLWQPPASGQAYFRELGRLLRVNKLAQAAGGTVGTRSLHDELDGEGVSEVGGYQIHRAYQRSMLDRDMAGIRCSGATDVQVVQFGGSSLSAHIEQSAAAWRATGQRVVTCLIPEHEQWWYAPDDSAEDRRPVTAKSVAATADWCADVVAQRIEPLS